MKKLTLIAALIAAAALPAFAEWRIDVGFDIPRGIGAMADGEAVISEDAGDFFDEYIFPFPEASVYYQRNAGPLRVGGGLRMYTFILESIFWPNAFAELDVWKVTFQFQFGGLLFGMFGLLNSIESGPILIPDLSVWYRIGNVFRVGGGAIGFMHQDLPDAIAFIYYFGAKFVVPLSKDT